LANAQSFSSMDDIRSGNMTIDRELNFPSKPNMTLDDFHSILFSDAPIHFGSRHLRRSESNELWFSALQYEWERAIQIESDTGSNLRSRRLQDSSVSFPYMACVMEQTTGENCHHKIEQLFGENMLPVHNSADKTCYIVSSSPNFARSAAPSDVQITPLLPESKIREGCTEQIETSSNLPTAIHAILTPGVASTEEEVKSIASVVMQTFTSNHRHLVSTHFLREDYISTSRHEERQRFWRRQLVDGLESGSCERLFEAIQVEVSDNNDAFTLNLPTASSELQLRECLHSLVAGLSIREEICSVEMRGEMKLLNAEAQWVTQSGVRDSLPLFDLGLDGSGQIVTVSDTGVDDDNCYFWDSTGSSVPRTGQFDLSKRKIVQYIPVADGGDTTRGHGTHVAGSAVGRRATQGTQESTGIADGMARAAKLSVVDIGTSRGSLSIPRESTLFTLAYNAGSRIHSASWGGPFNSYGFQERNYDRYISDNDDFLLVIAAGNDGEEGSGTVGSPATGKNSLAVGATLNASPHLRDGMRGPDYLAGFSARGPTRDGRNKPDVMAPGIFILSAEARSGQTGECDDTNPNGLLFNVGTSMSTPIVSGTAALVRQYFQEGFYPGGSRGSGSAINPSSALLKAVLMGSGQALAGIENSNLSVSPSSPYDFNQNFGRVTLTAALPLAGQNTISAIVRDRESISNGQIDTISVTINTSGCNQPLTATLVWIDPPAFSGCAQCLLNDLDLFIDGPGGRRYANGRSSPDSTNNAERIRITNFNNGETYTISVGATDLETSSQNYALLVSGCFAAAGPGPTPANPPPINPSPTSPAPVIPSPSEPPMTPSSPSSCEDGLGTFFISNSIGFQNCAWLRSLANQNTRNFLCTFADVSDECKQTCGSCDESEEIDDSGGLGPLSDELVFGAQPNGGFRWDGNMFDVVASRDLVITGMFLHLRSYFGTRNIQVWTKTGSYINSEFNQGDWVLIADVNLQSAGFGRLTTLPPENFMTQTMAPGERRAFYITVTGGTQDLVMNQGSSVGSVHVENSAMTIYQGNAITSRFGGASRESFVPYEINGGLRYAVYEQQVSVSQSSAGGCIDAVGDIDMGDRIGQRSCDWLADNKRRVSFLCEFADISKACRLTCGHCENSDS